MVTPTPLPLARATRLAAPKQHTTYNVCATQETRGPGHPPSSAQQSRALALAECRPQRTKKARSQQRTHASITSPSRWVRREPNALLGALAVTTPLDPAPPLVLVWHGRRGGRGVDAGATRPRFLSQTRWPCTPPHTAAASRIRARSTSRRAVRALVRTPHRPRHPFIALSQPPTHGTGRQGTIGVGRGKRSPNPTSTPRDRFGAADSTADRTKAESALSQVTRPPFRETSRVAHSKNSSERLIVHRLK